MPKLSKRDQKAKVSATEASRRKNVALAKLRELQLEREERKVLLAAKHFIADAAVRERNRFLGFVPRLAVKLIGEFDSLDSARLQRALDRHIREFLTERS
jgi:hypothetical protein